MQNRVRVPPGHPTAFCGQRVSLLTVNRWGEPMVMARALRRRPPGPRKRPTGIKAFKFAETGNGRSNPINGCRIRRALEHHVQLLNLGSDSLQSAVDVAIIRAFILRFRMCGGLDGSVVGFLNEPVEHLVPLEPKQFGLASAFG